MVGPVRCQAAPTGPSRSPPALQVPGATSRPLRATSRPGGHILRPDFAVMGANRLATASLSHGHVSVVCVANARVPVALGRSCESAGVMSGGVGCWGGPGAALDRWLGLFPFILVFSRIRGLSRVEGNSPQRGLSGAMPSPLAPPCVNQPSNSDSTNITGKREEEGGQPRPKGVVHPRELPLGLVGRRLVTGTQPV